jgi:hypothetical protein
LRAEIRERFAVIVSPSTIGRFRKTLGFRYQPPRHTQELRDAHIAARIAFCHQILKQPESLRLMHFSDKSRFVLGDGKRRLWYCRGEENEAAEQATRKFSSSMMVFTVIGIVSKSKLLFRKRTVDAVRCIENLSKLGLMEELEWRFLSHVAGSRRLDRREL